MADESKKVVLEIDLNIANSAKSLTELKALQKSLNVELGNAKIGTEEYKKFEVETGIVSKRIQQLTKDTKQLNAETDVQEGSLRDLQAQYNKLSQALRETAPGNKVLGLSFQDAQKKAKALKGEIGDFEEKLGNFQGNVGNYGGALKDASLNTGIFASQTNSLSAGFNGLKSGLNVAKLGFTTLRGAMLAVPIFALIAAFAALIAFFTKTEKGAEQLERVIAGIEAVFDVLIARSAMLGEALVQLFTGDFVGAAKTASVAFDDIGGAITSAANEAVALKQRLQDLEDEELKQSVINAKRKNEVDLLIKQSKDRTRSETERLGLLNKAGKIEEDGAKKEIALAKERLDIANKQLATDIKNKVIDEGNISKDAADAEIAYQNALGNSAEKLAAIQARKAAFLLEEDKMRDDAIKEEQKRADESVKIEAERLAKLREIQAAENARRIARVEKIDAAEYALRQGRLQNQIKDIDNSMSIESEALEKSLSNTNLTELEKSELIQNSTNKQIELLNERAAKEAEIAFNAMTLSLENTQLEADERTLIEENYTQAKEDRDAALAKATDKAQKDGIAKRKATADKEIEIEKKKNQIILQTTGNILGNIGSLFDESSAEYKDIAIAQALISTYEGAAAAYATGSEINPIFGAVAAAAAVVAGLGYVAKISGVTFEDGGIAGSGSKQAIIGGNYHSNGGTKFYGSDGSFFEAERDELLTVVNRHDTKKLRNLSALNSTHGTPFYAMGGIAGSGGRRYLQDGGFAARAASGGAESSRQNLQDILAIVEALPPPVVGVADVLTGVQKRSRVRVNANLTKKT